MVFDRDEIRWQFQIILDDVNSTIEKNETAMKLTDENSVRTLENVERKRNELLGGIGFIITIVITLIASDKIDNTWYQFAGFAGICGWFTYFGFEMMIKKEKRINLEIMLFYLKTIGSKLSPLKKMIGSLAMNENITEKDLLLIKNYITTYVQAVDYELDYKIYNKSGGDKLGTEKLGDEIIGRDHFNHEQYREYYNLAQSNLDDFKKFNFSLGTNIFEKFIKDFESNTAN